MHRRMQEFLMMRSKQGLLRPDRGEARKVFPFEASESNLAIAWPRVRFKSDRLARIDYDRRLLLRTVN